MYGYTTHVPAPIEVYHALHRAIVDVIEEQGGGDGLLVHLAYPTDEGFDLTEVWESREQLDAFNRDVFPAAVARAGVSMEGPPPDPVEFAPALLVTTRAFSSDAAT